MTTGLLITRFRQGTAYDFDPITGLYPEGGTEEEIDAWNASVVTFLDEAMVELANLAYLTADAVALTLSAGIGSYALTSNAFASRVVEPFSVVVNGRRLRNAADNDYGLWAASELTRVHPTWATDTASEPTKAVFFGDRLVLHPAPSVDGTAYVEGKVAPPALSASDLNGVPGLPERLHPHIARYAIYLACRDMAQENSQFARLQAMKDGAEAVANDIGTQNMAARVGSVSTAVTQRRERIYL